MNPVRVNHRSSILLSALITFSRASFTPVVERVWDSHGAAQNSTQVGMTGFVMILPIFHGLTPKKGKGGVVPLSLGAGSKQVYALVAAFRKNVPKFGKSPFIF